jgi:hypothetical protein
VVQPEILLPTVGCELVYFDDEERADYGIPHDAIGALRPHQRLIFIYQKIRNVGREGQTVGEEIGHFILHAKGVVDIGQQSLTFDETLPHKQASTFFCRTERGAFVDDKEEPAWMTREAAFFAACIQMPRDRYQPVAEKRLAQAIEYQPSGSGCLRPLEEKLRLAGHYIAQAQSVDIHAYNIKLLMPGVFDTGIIEDALELLETDHEGQVSKEAQRRRFTELGLALDAADVFAARHVYPNLPRFSEFFLSYAMISRLKRK